MGDLCQTKGFLAKLPARRIAHQSELGKNLEGNVAVKPLIMRAINHSHTARSYLFDNAVMAE